MFATSYTTYSAFHRTAISRFLSYVIYIWTLNLLKGLLADSDTLSTIAKKVWVLWKNCKYIFCSFWCDLFEKKFGQQVLTSVLTKLGWIPKIGQISGQKHEVCKWQGGFLVMRYLTTIFGEKTLQSILSTLPNTYGPNVSTHFRIESQKTWKRDFGLFLVPFYWHSGFLRILRRH